MSEWIDTYEAPDWHSIAASRDSARTAAAKALGLRPWTQPMSVPTPEWLIPGLLQREALHMFSSDKGCYKTWLGLSLMLGGIYGTPVLGMEPMARFSTLYVAADSPNWDIGAQLRKLVAANAVLPSLETDSFILPFGVQFTNEEHVKLLVDMVVAYDIDHLAIDVKGYTQGNLDENSDAEQMLYYRVMKHFRDRLKVAVTIFHHFAKTTGKPRGAGTTEQAVEHSFLLTKNRAGLVTLTRDKIRGDEMWEKKSFTLARVGEGRQLEEVVSPAPTATTGIAAAVREGPPETTSKRPHPVLEYLSSGPKSRAQLLTLYTAMGKSPKSLDNKLQNLRRAGSIILDSDLWRLT
jgi:AAA domain